MTQLEAAKKSSLTPLMKKVAAFEKVPPRFIMTGMKKGNIVVPLNKKRRISRPCAIGAGLITKVNANIGTSTDKPDLPEELRKLEVAEKYGADAVMDLSIGGDLRAIRRKVLAASNIPLGTVPIYEIAVNAQKNEGDFLGFSAKDILETLRYQAEEGVDFFTIHCGVIRKSLRQLRKNKRLLGIVSRGGAMLASWISRNKKENPFYEYFDKILDIAYEYDVTLSLGDGLRPGSILDATDQAQITELKILGELARACRKRNVQVMIEGPGHVPLDQIKKNIELEKKICGRAPFYVLGPLVTDIAAGYDHISGAIGGALAAGYGADFLCYVTPAEHLRHPSIDDVRQGVIASRIAGHAADIVKGVGGALERDRRMSVARSRRDWRQQIALCIDPEKAREYRLSSKPDMKDVCTMCGKYCSIRLMECHFK
ncbi:MAG: phosphomethylpyrimidine synthase ThiC [Candidatus Omnitrophica bacterium]|nr:phosphomethylpyrimidine synthase ThiC [Candidatus Omnitrophota bacterium]